MLFRNKTKRSFLQNEKYLHKTYRYSLIIIQCVDVIGTQVSHLTHGVFASSAG